MPGFHLSPLALCCRFQRGCSVFNCMNVAAVFAPKKVYGCPGSVAFNCVPKLQCAAATRTRPTIDFCRVHAVLLSSPQLKIGLHRRLFRRNQSLAASHRSTIVTKAEVHSDHPLCCVRGGPIPKCSIASPSAVSLPP